MKEQFKVMATQITGSGFEAVISQDQEAQSNHLSHRTTFVIIVEGMAGEGTVQSNGYSDHGIRL